MDKKNINNITNNNNNTNNNNIFDNINNNDELLEPWGYYLAGSILFLIGFFGFTLNLLVIIFMCKDIQLWTPMNIILFNLVCSDFLVSIFGNPFTLIAALSHKWIFGRVLCIAYGFLMALLGITSITTLTVLAYERYYLVKYPLSIRKIRNRGAVISVILIWTYSLALTTPPLFGWGAYVNEAAGISCSVNWETQTLNATTYIVFLFIFGLVVPVIVISFSYINIIFTMRKNSIRLGRKSRGERHITYMVAIMISAFMIAWTPYATFALIEQFGSSDLISPQIAVIPAIIAKSSICYNPLIYVGMNTQFRASWKRFLNKGSFGVDTTTNKLSQTNESMVFVDCGPISGRQNKKENFFLKTAKITSSLTDNNQKLVVKKENYIENIVNTLSDQLDSNDLKQEINLNSKSEEIQDLNSSDIKNDELGNSGYSIKHSISLCSIKSQIESNVNSTTTTNYFSNDNNSDKSDSNNSTKYANIKTYATTIIADGKQIKTLIKTESNL